MEGKQIRESPSFIAVKSPVEKLGTPLLTLGGVCGPMGVAINKRGEVVVTEGDGYCVSVFSPGGVKLRSFGTQGSDQGQFKWPFGVAVENILVADTTSRSSQLKVNSSQLWVRQEVDLCSSVVPLI